jgi:hypothetical protein
MGTRMGKGKCAGSFDGYLSDVVVSISHDAYQLVAVCGSGEVGLDLVERRGYVRTVGHSMYELLVQVGVSPHYLGIVIEANGWIRNVLEKVEAVGELRFVGEIAEAYEAALIDRPHRPPVVAQTPAVELEVPEQAAWITSEQIA